MANIRNAKAIMKYAFKESLPDQAVAKALQNKKFPAGKLVLVAMGKAAWQMAHKAAVTLGEKLTCGIVVTKYGHAMGKIPKVEIYEAGHPVPDENSFKATARAIEMVSGLSKNDTVVFLVSGGGSALFEKPLIPAEELQKLTKQFLAKGMDIVEINTLRKRLSAVKGGKFAQLCRPAHVYTVILSDIIGSPLDMIASGPAYPDSSTTEEAMSIVKKYDLELTPEAQALLEKETPKHLDNVTTVVTGSVSMLCKAAERKAKELGYKTILLTTSLDCEARDAGRFLAAIAKEYADSKKPLAFIAGGETLVHLTGKGRGGRNQEIALSAAAVIAGLKNVVVLSAGSDGTDGPTDAAGGYCDGTTAGKLLKQGIHIDQILRDNASYDALKAAGNLIITGPTGTNVNDLSLVLIN